MTEPLDDLAHDDQDFPDLVIDPTEVEEDD